MEDVTDAAFRRLIARHGKPHVLFSEFTSADGLVLAPESGRSHLRRKLLYSEEERPIVAQLFSAIPERMEKTASIVREMGFDGIDINMGCPDRAIERGLCGAAMMRNPALAREVIRAAKRGWEGRTGMRVRLANLCESDSHTLSPRNAIKPTLPISVKTRIGYTRNELETWLPVLLGEGLAAITIHARTRDEMSDVPAHWETIQQAVAIRDALGSSALIVGNGDVKNLTDARTKAAETGCDGVMLGRAIYGNPWLFAEHTPSSRERVEALIEHLHLFDELLGDMVNYATMKKHFKAYVSGWDGAKELRARLMETGHAGEAIKILKTS